MFKCSEVKTVWGTREIKSGKSIDGTGQPAVVTTGGELLETLNNHTSDILAKIIAPWNTGDDEQKCSVANQMFNDGYYNSTGNKLYNLRNLSEDQSYKGVRRFIAAAFHSMRTSSGIFGTFKTVRDERDKFKQDSDKLFKLRTEPGELNSFIEEIANQKSGFTIFDNQIVNAMKATLKPNFAIYISLYGIPEYGSFDPDKVAKIEELITTITEQTPEITDQNLIANVITLLNNQGAT